VSGKRWLSLSERERVLAVTMELKVLRAETFKAIARGSLHDMQAVDLRLEALYAKLAALLAELETNRGAGSPAVH